MCLHMACAGYREMLRHRDTIELRDKAYGEIEPLFKKLDASIVDDEDARLAL